MLSFAVQEATLEGMVAVLWAWEALCYLLLPLVTLCSLSFQVGSRVLRPLEMVEGGASVPSGFMGSDVLWNWDS